MKTTQEIMDKAMKNLREHPEIVEEYNKKHPQPPVKEIDRGHLPTCPICGSTSLTKITNTHKVAKIAMFGIFGMGENGKTWRCLNCGMRF